MTATAPHLFVIFGATGDLTARKLLPALYRLVSDDQGVVVLGVGSTDLDDDAFRARAREALAAAGHEEAAAWCDDRVHYQRIPRGGDLAPLAERIAAVEERHGLPGNRVLYLALPPGGFPDAIAALGDAGLHEGPGWTRLVVEKPFGRDLDTARALNDLVHRWFREDQVYRIDHYLGKDTVQNLLVFRFSNPVFEGSWNRDRIDRVEITVSEALGVEGRGGYYDTTGAVRDMIQSHLMQVLCLVAMEAPTSIEAAAVRAETVKVLRAIRPVDPGDVVLGQYRAGTVDGEEITPFLETPGVDPESRTPSYAAVRLAIDNWRWQGVPFVVRTGKAMERRLTEIAVAFRAPPVCLFHGVDGDDCTAHADLLYLTLQPDEGFSLEIEVREPSRTGRLRSVPLRFRYAEAFGELPEAYETLLRDVIDGDQTRFVHADWIEESWRLFDPILTADLPVAGYPAGSWGPGEANRLLPEHAATWASGG